MLFKTLGYSSSLFNIAIVYSLFHNGIITEIGTPHWNIGIGSILLLSIFSISFFYINNKNEGLNAIKAYSIVYTTLGIILFGYYAVHNLLSSLSFNEFKGFMLLFSTLIFIGLLTNIAINQKSNYKILELMAGGLSILTMGITFATIYKYVIMQTPIIFNILFMDLFMILAGSILFIGFHYYNQKNK